MNYGSNIQFEASAQHRSGIETMELFYKLNGGNYISILMNNTQDNYYACEVSGIPANTEIEYYFKATALSGKVINRLIVAPRRLLINFQMT